MLPLAWILGFAHEPKPDGNMLVGAPIQDMIEDFIGDVDASVCSWLKKCEPRSEIEVFEKEDLFYCAHNAVRSAQVGRNTVPDNFHPVINGGVIHERRHSLTWAISPGVHWDETELST